MTHCVIFVNLQEDMSHLLLDCAWNSDLGTRVLEGLGSKHADQISPKYLYRELNKYPWGFMITWSVESLNTSSTFFEVLMHFKKKKKMTGFVLSSAKISFWTKQQCYHYGTYFWGIKAVFLQSTLLCSIFWSDLALTKFECRRRKITTMLNVNKMATALAKYNSEIHEWVQRMFPSVNDLSIKSGCYHFLVKECTKFYFFRLKILTCILQQNGACLSMRNTTARKCFVSNAQWQDSILE